MFHTRMSGRGTGTAERSCAQLTALARPFQEVIRDAATWILGRKNASAPNHDGFNI
jgi:hypothetical protein